MSGYFERCFHMTGIVLDTILVLSCWVAEDSTFLSNALHKSYTDWRVA